MRRALSKHTRNKGFTLIEVIVVLVILVISAVFGVSSLRGLTKNAEQRARNDVARTIFMAAQTTLTQRYNQDRDFALNGHFKGAVINNPDFAAILINEEGRNERQKALDGKLVQLVSNPDHPSQELRDWLSPQMNDKEVFAHAILIEYDKETGRVLSAFYSEKEIGGAHVTLGYGGEASYDVLQRSKPALAAGYVGYYGVDYTGQPIRTEPIDPDDFHILFRDYTSFQNTAEPYGILTAEVTLPIEAEKLDPAFTYTLEMTADKGTGKEVITFSDTDATADFTLQELLTTHSSLAEAMAEPFERNGRQIVAYRENAGGSGGGANAQRLIFVLDCVESYGAYTKTKNLSIRTNFPSLTNGYLEGALTIDDGAIPKTVYSDYDTDQQVHALFIGQNEDGAYEIASVRHLNNIRYLAEAERYTQTESLYLRSFERKQLNFTPICNFNDPRPDGADESTYGFLGTFVNAGDLRVYDLHVDLTKSGESGMALQNAGLFDTIQSGGSVTGVRFATTDLEEGLVLPVNADRINRTASVVGIASAGGIAGVNNGRIERCTVLGKIVAQNEDGESIAGGIAGGNLASGIITNCFTAAEVRAGKYVGGVAGSSLGEIYGCEAGTASRRISTDPTRMYLTGIPYFGARVGQQSGYLANATANNTFRIVIEDDGGAAGGIAGALFEGATVKNCVSACKVEAGNESEDAEGGTHSGGRAGGIAGYVGVNGDTSVTVSYCYNAGAVYATDSAGGLIGELHRGRLENSYNSGYVNREFTYKIVDRVTYYLQGKPRNITDGNTHYKTGGIVGFGSGEEITIWDCYSAQYAGNRYGGAFGVLDRDAVKSGKIQNCCFLQNVLNNTRTHYWLRGENTYELVPSGEDVLNMYSHKNLREAPSVSPEKLTSFAFAPGRTNPGAGMFGYTFPTLQVADSKASATHRTPYNPVVENYGWIKLSGQNSNLNGVITATFGATPDEEVLLEFIVRTDRGDTRTFYVPIGKYDKDDFPTLHRHVDGHYGNDDYDYVYGYDTYPPKQEPVEETDSIYTLEIKAFTATEATDGYDGYKYVLYFNTHASKKVHDTLLEGLNGNLTKLEVWLYNAEKGLDVGSHTDMVDYDSWPKNQRIWLADEVYLGYLGTPVTMRELCIELNDSKTPTKVNFNYRSALLGDQSIVLRQSAMSSAKGKLSDAVEKRNSWIRIDGILPTLPRPYYIDKSTSPNVLKIVLWAEPNLYMIPTEGTSGLMTSVSVTVTASGGATASEGFDRLDRKLP